MKTGYTNNLYTNNRIDNYLYDENGTIGKFMNANQQQIYKASAICHQTTLMRGNAEVTKVKLVEPREICLRGKRWIGSRIKDWWNNRDNERYEHRSIINSLRDRGFFKPALWIQKKIKGSMVYHAPIDTTNERCWLKYKLIYNETDRLGYIKYTDR